MRIAYLSGNTNQFSQKVIKTLKEISSDFIDIIKPTPAQITKIWANYDLIVWDWCKGGIELLSSMPKRSKIIVLGKAGDILPRMEYACVRERFKRRKDLMSINSVSTYKTLEKVNWKNIDLLLFESEHIKDEFEELYPDNKCAKDTVLHRDFNYQIKNKFHNIACLICRISIEKDIEFAIEVFKRTPYMKLIIQGPKTNSNHAEWFDISYFKELQVISDGCSNIEFREWKDPFETYAESSIIISTSISEGIASSVMEGMSMGCYPIIRNWIGADKCYPYATIVSSINHFSLELSKWYNLSNVEKKEASNSAMQNIKNDPHKGGEPEDILKNKIYELFR